MAHSKKSWAAHPGKNPHHRFGQGRDREVIAGMVLYGPKNPGRWLPHTGAKELSRKREAAPEIEPTYSRGPMFARAEKRCKAMAERKALAFDGSATAAKGRHAEVRRPKSRRAVTAAALRSPVPDVSHIESRRERKAELRRWANERIREQQEDACDRLVRAGLGEATARQQFGSL